MNAGTPLGQLSACFAPEQVILTRGGPKQIKDIKVGDEVLTHRNRYRKVMDVFVRDSDHLNTVKVWKLPGKTLRVTDEHPVLAIKNGGAAEPAWIRMCDLQPGDYVALAHPEQIIDVDRVRVLDIINDPKCFEVDGKVHRQNYDVARYTQKDGTVSVKLRNRSGAISKQAVPVKNEIIVDEDLMRLFGYYLAEGCADNDCVRFTFSLKEQAYANEILTTMKEKFDIESTIEYNKDASRKWISLRFHSKVLAQFFFKLFGTGFNKKTIPDWMLLLPQYKQKALLCGMFRGDGTFFVQGKESWNARLVMCNQQLVYAAWQTLMRCGCFGALGTSSMPKLGTTQPYQVTISGSAGTQLMTEFYQMQIPQTATEWKRHIVVNGTIFTPIESIVKEPYSGEVYNLEVEEDHSYVANMVAVHNCFVLPVEDDLRSIFHTLENQMLIHQSGGGTGFSFGRLRPKGDLVRSTQGVASGPVSFMTIYDKATEVIKQGGKRRGANMGILPVEHPDIEEFINAKRRPGMLENFNVSVAVSDKFMDAVAKDQDFELVNPRNKKTVKKVKAKEVWNQMVQAAWECGDPGVVFIDEINRKQPTPQVGLIESTNPCLAGNVRLATDHGLLTMKELYTSQKEIMVATDNRVPAIRALVGKGCPVEIPAGGGQLLHMLNATQLAAQPGCTLRPALPVFLTRKQAHVYRLVTDHGYEILATDNHKFFTPDGLKELKDLQAGDTILLQSGGVWSTKNELPAFTPDNKLAARIQRGECTPPHAWSAELGELLGWIIGDGFVSADLPDGRNAPNYCVGMMFGNEEKKLLAPKFKTLVKDWLGLDGHETEQQGVLRLVYKSALYYFLKPLGVKLVDGTQKRVPEALWSAPREAVLGFLRALFTADGTVNVSCNKGSCSIRLANSSKELLKDVQLLLLNEGIVSRLHQRRGAGQKLMPDSSRNLKPYAYAAQYELILDKENRDHFTTNIGFLMPSKQRKAEEWIASKKRESNHEPFLTIVREIVFDSNQDVYCTTEHETHSICVNGLVTAQCGEVPLLPYEPCNLGSINLSKMVKNGKIHWEKLKQTVRTATHFLDNVIDANKWPLPEIEAIAKANRKIGLGVMGWAECLARCGIRYDSDKATDFAEKVAKFIQDESRKRSVELAQERGSFPNLPRSIHAKKYKALRNATCTTIAPTGTISIIANATSGIEPFYAVSFVRDVMGGTKLLEVNPYFEQLAKERGFHSKQLMVRISRSGSIQKAPGIPADVKKLFVTSFDIKPEWHVKHQAAWQKFSDNAVSKTVNMPNNAKPQDVDKTYQLAYKLKCKGITIFRYGSKKEQVLYVGKLPPEHVTVQEEFAGGCPSEVCPF
jgi:ribonucleoside-diphosphate reductase alpha chain